MELFKKRPLHEYILYTAIILAIILLDVITKVLTVEFIAYGESIPVIKGILNFSHIHNEGAAWGMLANHRWVFLVVSSVTIIALSLYLYLGHAQNKLYGISISMIVAGGIGNMIDRVGIGYVVDFIDFRLINFAIFNGADSFVCVGAGLLILALILDLSKESKNKKA
jgi:signal peptidase II